MTLLDVRALRAAHAHIDVLHDLSIEVDADKIVTLIGANGAGKTTTLLAISGLVRKTGGSITFDGRDITRMPAHEIVRLGLIHVPEGRGIFPKLSVEENLRMGAFSRSRWDASELERAYELFPILGDRRKQMGGTLSGGEQQMLAIARGLMAAPKMLLLDEPSLGIAPKLVDRIFEALRRIHKDGCPILLVEQNARRALELADRAYVIETGVVTIKGTGRELLANAEVERAYLGI
ncbi:MAG: ABC transporter ATP-binding protein [Candidatus Hydrogenedentota bacterium]|mgnify:CR=1 FL=1